MTNRKISKDDAEHAPLQKVIAIDFDGTLFKTEWPQIIAPNPYVIEPSVELINPVPYQAALNTIEIAGRTCYQSENKMTDDSAEGFIRRIIQRGHESVLEHVCVTARFVCDRGVSHEIVRHRIGAYSQESTRYCNYSGDKFGSEITVINPLFTGPNGFMQGLEWTKSCISAETTYLKLIHSGASPQEARSVLPNSLKTTIVVTYDIREWRHFLRLRCAPEAHPQMRQVADMARKLLTERYPVFFEDINDLGV